MNVSSDQETERFIATVASAYADIRGFKNIKEPLFTDYYVTLHLTSSASSRTVCT